MMFRSRRKKWLAIAGAVFLTIAIALLTIPRIVGPMVRSKLIELASTHLDSDLSIGALTYRIPFTVRVENARLRPRGGRAPEDLLHIAHAELTLDRSPLRSGPLLIRRIILQEPTLHVVAGEHGNANLTAATKPAQAEGESRKLSDLFRLRHLSISGGKVIFEDRAIAGAVPMVWERLGSELKIHPQSPSLYQYQFAAQNHPVADLSVEGTIEIDQLQLVVQNLVLNAQADPDAATSPVPINVQKFLQSHGIRGRVEIAGSGTMPLRESNRSHMHATITFSDAQARLPTLDRPLQKLSARIECEKPAGNQRFQVKLPQASAQVGADRLVADGAAGWVDLDQRAWRLEVPRALAQFSGDLSIAGGAMQAQSGSIELMASLAGPLDAESWTWSECSGAVTFHDVSARIAGFAQPIESIHGNVRLGDGALHAQALGARFGKDEWAVASARVPLESIPQKITIYDIKGQAKFNAPSTGYPAAVGNVIAQLRPGGFFDVHGAVSVDNTGATTDSQWDLMISTQDGVLAVTNEAIPLNAVRGRAQITPDQVQVHELAASAFAGSIALNGTVDLSDVTRFWGSMKWENIDLSALSADLKLLSRDGIKLVGSGSGSVDFRAEKLDLAALTADGELTITGGQLWEAPVLKLVSSETKVAREALTAGEAAAVFRIADSQINLEHGVVYSKALGVQGSGTVGFDGSLNLDVVAAPLGDWEQHIKKLQVPIMSEVVGTIAGVMQKAVGGASKLLYEFRVTGNARNPDVVAVPAPMLTDAAAGVFEQMLRKPEGFIESMRQRRRQD